MEIKQERKNYFKKMFYQKWKNYGNYLEWKNKQKKEKSNFVLKVSQGICPKCQQGCEVVNQSFKDNFSWFPIGFNCSNCGYKQKVELNN